MWQPEPELWKLAEEGMQALTRAPTAPPPAEADAGPALRRLPRRLLARYQRSSLYARVVTVNGAILVAAAALLALTPATVSFPLGAEQGLILGVGVVVMLVANAVLLRISFRGLAGLVRRMETLDVLQPRQRLPVLGGVETRALIEGFNVMLERLEAERRASTRRALSALEGERRRIGQELHDEIGQRLTGMLLQLGGIAAETTASLRPFLAAVQEEARATLDEVGALAWQLRPGVLDDLGLLSALEALVQTLQEHAESRIETSLPAQLEPMTPEVELAIYRIVQESLTNALRHSGARRIALKLSVDDRGLSLRVADDGRGFEGDVSEGPGIRGMRERALLIGGRLRIDSPWRRGVRIRLDVPHGNLLD